MCVRRLLISGSKVRVLDDPPITSGTSRTAEVPGLFLVLILVLLRSKSRCLASTNLVRAACNNDGSNPDAVDRLNGSDYIDAAVERN